MIRILLVDDHEVVREGLAAILETQPDFQIAGEAGDGMQAIEMAGTLRPDVILLDLEMPGMDGLAALRAIRAANPDTKILVFTAFDTDERIFGAVQAGAQGYLLKGAHRDQLFQAIRVVHSGGSLLEPTVAAKLIRRVSAGEAGEAAHLTERELEVLKLLAVGQQNKEIAAALMISERTVKFHMSSILNKLGAGNRTEAVAIAAQQGLIEL